MRDPTSAFAAHYERLDLLRHRLDSAVQHRLRAEEADLRAAVSSIRALSPKHTLERGYAVLVGAGRESVSSITDTAAGEQIHAYLADGELTLNVIEINSKEQHG